MKYKNISGVAQDLVGFGLIEPDGIVESLEIFNQNFALVEDKKPVEKVEKTETKEAK